MENSIEEDIKIAVDKFSDNKDIDSAMLIVEKFILGNYILLGGNRGNIVKDSLRYILSDYKRALKENEVLLKENKELQKEIDQMKSLDIYKLVEDWETGQFIPVQKVKDKIEELKKKVEELTDDKGYWGGSDLLEQIKVLQELLEENENHIPRID